MKLISMKRKIREKVHGKVCDLVQYRLSIGNRHRIRMRFGVVERTTQRFHIMTSFRNIARKGSVDETH